MTATATETEHIAITYARRGWRVVPIWWLNNGVCACRAGVHCKRSPGKHPYDAFAPKGVHSASSDPDTVKAWLEKAPRLNWGLAMGDGVVAVDVDPRNGGDETLGALIAQHGPLPHTVRAISGGNGEHYLFATTEKLGGGTVGEGIDFKATGGYILAEPSTHVSGGSYHWDAGAHPDETEIAPLPEWIRAKVEEVREKKPTEGDAEDTLLGEAFKLAGMLGDVLTEGRRAVVCPWAEEHTDERGHGKDSSTVIMPAAIGGSFGGFKCLHGHCQHRRWTDVIDALPDWAVAAAKGKYPLRPVLVTLPADAVATTDAWKARLVLTKKREIDECLTNAITVLMHDPKLAGHIRLDEFAGTVRGHALPWDRRGNEWSDVDDTRLAVYLRLTHGVEFAMTDVQRAVFAAAEAHSYHEVRDYLAGLTWDGKQRLPAFLPSYFGAPDTEYARAIGPRWLISGVARVYEPGCKADCMLILEGSQGAGKSTGLRALFGDSWFFDSNLPIGDKDGYQALHGKWGIEIAELDAMDRRQLTTIKAFFSAQSDHYRSSYGRHATTHPRQCIFAGTTNEVQYLKDGTGGRRFWPVEVGAVDVAGLKRDRDQLWAEARTRYESGERWYADTSELRELCEVEQAGRRVVDPWEYEIEDWLVRSRPADLTVRAVLKGLGLVTENLKGGEAQRVGRCLRSMGYRTMQPKGRSERLYVREP